MNGERYGRVLYGQRRAIIAVAIAAAVSGVLAWLSMPKQEDPTLTNLFGSAVVTYPGADAESIERLVVIPTEDEVRGVAEVRHLDVSIRPGVAVFSIELDGTVTDPDPVWTRVDRALDRAALEYPGGVDRADASWTGNELEAVIVAITGTGDILRLWDAAESLERALRSEPTVQTVRITPEPDREVAVTVAEESSQALGAARSTLATSLAARLRAIPGGAIRFGTRTGIVDPSVDLRTVEEVDRAIVPLAGGSLVPLSSVASVSLQRAAPLESVARLDGRLAVTVGAVARADVDLITFGDRLQAIVDSWAVANPGFETEIVSFQPRYVDERLAGLRTSLLLGIGIVAAVVIVAMGVRLGLTVAVMVPVVALAGLAIYAAAGGVLHQISIAALVMSLGLLVDNAIVVAERIQTRLDGGEGAIAAAGETVRELAVPLAAATGTTLAAYLPLLLARGTTSEFTAAIPQVVMITLALSFVFAVTVTPAIALLTLRPSRHAARSDTSGAGVVARAATLATRRPRGVVIGAVVAVVAVVALVPTLPLSFFPSVDRTQFVVDVELPRGTDVSATSSYAARVEDELASRPEVRRVLSFSGRTLPAFYYNLIPESNAPHRAQMLVEVDRLASIENLSEHLLAFAEREMPHVVVLARRLEQGPPVAAPIELRVRGNDPEALAREIETVAGTLKGVPGTRGVRTTLAPAVPTFVARVDDAQATRLGIGRADVARALLAVSRGIEAGELTLGDERVPVVVRSIAGERTPAEDLATLAIHAPALRRMVPLAAVARIETDMRPVDLERRDGARTAAVYAELAPGAAYNRVLAALEDSLPPATDGITRSVGGSAEESAEANSAIAGASYLGVVVLLSILLIQFRSFRRVAIILTTVPLAAVGVIPGLFLSGSPFGFTSMLGVIALIGIVVNNAIILVDFIDGRRADGVAIEEAVRRAIVERFRPIVLTAATTILGMVPLLFSAGTLWPPFASAIMSGLAASTVLTLLVVPALYLLLFRREDGRLTATPIPVLLVAGFLVTGLLLPGTLEAQERRSLGAIADAAANNELVTARQAEYDATGAALRAVRREPLAPVIALESELLRRNEALTSDQGPPIGSVEAEPDWEAQTALVLSQPLFRPAALFGTIPAAAAARRGASFAVAGARRTETVEALDAALTVLELEAQQTALEKSVDALQAQSDRLALLVEAGRALASDRDRVELQQLEVRQTLGEVSRAIPVVAADLARLVASPASVVLPAPPGTGRLLADGAGLAGRGEGFVERNADRAELLAVEYELTARRRAVQLGALPELTGEVRLIRPENAEVDQDMWLEGAIELRWSPVTGGVRLARAKELADRHAAISARRAMLERGLAVSAARRETEFIDAREGLELRRRGVALAERLFEESSTLFEAGRITGAEFLDAEADLLHARSALARAEVELARAVIAWRDALGLPIVPDDGWEG